ncbi:MAG: hypothetical protein HZB81_07020 [Deltaproteobacteria bacterium]|nr:hypothetical protein [Deltaproteobacteria bacterium]
MPKQGEEAEKKVKEFLEKEFGKPFSKQKVVIGKGKKKEFDLVSNDGKIVVEVKDFKFDNETTGKSGYSSTRKHRLISACCYLAKVHAEKKMLALTNQEICEQFKKDMDMEQLHPEIEIIYVPMKS